MRDNSFEKEFPEAADKRERVAAKLILIITKQFQSDHSAWLKPADINMLAEDSLKSELRELALQSTWLIPYSRQLFDYGSCPSKFVYQSEPSFRIDRHLAQKLKDSDKPLDKSNPMSTLFSQLLLSIEQHQNGFEIMRKDSPNDRAFHVRFMTEGATDTGGPYRELFESICAELMSKDLPLLVETVNGEKKYGVT